MNRVSPGPSWRSGSPFVVRRCTIPAPAVCWTRPPSPVHPLAIPVQRTFPVFQPKSGLQGTPRTNDFALAMASDERFPEQDTEGGDNLPTYDDLAERHGANSRYVRRGRLLPLQHSSHACTGTRFGRWRSWIEKRCASRGSSSDGLL